MWSPLFPATVTYMLQSVEYEAISYLKWFWRTNNFTKVMNRRSLDKTRIARYITLFLWVGIGLQVLIAWLCVVLGAYHREWSLVIVAVMLVLLAPLIWAHVVVIPISLARVLIIKPRLRQKQAEAQTIFRQHTGAIIAVAGSYGKTTMKEILVTVLGQAKKVAATPANKNTISAHYDFAKSLNGDEDVLIIEYGESRLGDVRQFAEMTCPDIGVITGLAPAHLEGYGSVEAAGSDIFALAEYLKDQNVYVNAESSELSDFIKPSHIPYTRKGIGNLKVGDITVDIHGTKFHVGNDDGFDLHTQLLGEHLVGPLLVAVMIGQKLGLTQEQIRASIEQTKPYEHRMQPYELAGAWVIDDTYNGNIEGVRAGTELLAKLKATRKLYVTPGLVEQGKETKSVHEEMGRLIAAAKPDIVVLMKNSVTDYIQKGLAESGFSGQLRIESDPLKFYTHLSEFIAVGDVVLMQNDWTDNYN